MTGPATGIYSFLYHYMVLNPEAAERGTGCKL